MHSMVVDEKTIMPSRTPISISITIAVPSSGLHCSRLPNGVRPSGGIMSPPLPNAKARHSLDHRQYIFLNFMKQSKRCDQNQLEILVVVVAPIISISCKGRKRTMIMRWLRQYQHRRNISRKKSLLPCWVEQRRGVPLQQRQLVHLLRLR